MQKIVGDIRKVSKYAIDAKLAEKNIQQLAKTIDARGQFIPAEGVGVHQQSMGLSLRHQIREYYFA